MHHGTCVLCFLAQASTQLRPCCIGETSQLYPAYTPIYVRKVSGYGVSRTAAQFLRDRRWCPWDSAGLTEANHCAQDWRCHGGEMLSASASLYGLHMGMHGAEIG